MPCSTTTLYHLQRSLQLSPSATALLNIGDLSYADDVQTTGAYAQVNGVWQYNGNEGFTSRSYQPVWDAWLRFIQPLIATVSFTANPMRVAAACLTACLHIDMSCEWRDHWRMPSVCEHLLKSEGHNQVVNGFAGPPSADTRVKLSP